MSKGSTFSGAKNFGVLRWKGHENYQQRPQAVPESTPLEHEHSISKNILSQCWVPSDHNLWLTVARRGSPNHKKSGLFFQAEFVEMDLPPIFCYCGLPCQPEEPYNGRFLMEVPVDRKPERQRSQQPLQWGRAFSVFAKQTFHFLSIPLSNLGCAVSVNRSPSSPGSNFCITCECNHCRIHVLPFRLLIKAIKDVKSRNSHSGRWKPTRKKEIHTYTCRAYATVKAEEARLTLQLHTGPPWKWAC